MKFYKNFVIFWSIIYLTLAFTGRFLSKKKEWYPFFRWSLYSKSNDKLEVSYVMVYKLGDSIFEKPKKLKTLEALHHLSSADIYAEYLKINEDFENNKAFNNLFFKDFFKQNSEYVMFKKKFDLRKEDYKEPTITKQLEFRNGKIKIYD